MRRKEEAAYQPLTLVEEETKDEPQDLAFSRKADIQDLHKTDILHWFQQSSDSDASWVAARLAEVAPMILYDALHDQLDSLSKIRKEAVDMSQATKISADDKKEYELASIPVVQFTSNLYFAEEGKDNPMVLDVMRIGNQQGTSEVFFETQDDSAISGRSYAATSGKLVFEPGVHLVHIEIPIVDNPLWDTTTEFRCLLKEEGLKGAVLGQYLYMSRVKIIDNDHFPTTGFDDLTSLHKVEQTPKWPLLFGYFKLVANITNVWCGTLKYVLVDFIKNALFLLNLFMTAYMLDFIMDTSSPISDLLFVHDRRGSLMSCSLITLLSVATLHILDYNRLTFPIKSPARNFLQAALLRKFLNYKGHVRERLQQGSVMMGITNDSSDLVTFGYINALKVLSALGKIACMVGFKLVAPCIFGGHIDWASFGLLFAVPILLAIFLRIRTHTTTKAFHDRNIAQNEFASQISATTTNYHLVIDYSLRNHCEHKFLQAQKQYGDALRNTGQLLENNMYFCSWCESLLIAVWIMYGGLRVVNGNLTVGLWVTNMRLFESLGKAFLEIYSLVVKMMDTFPALENVTHLLNEATDVRQRCHLKRAQRHEAKELWENLLKDRKDKITPVLDMMPIVLNFENLFKFEGKKGTLNFNGRVSIEQGQLVALVGPRGCGKATLLRLIVSSVLPEEGTMSSIFVPAHLRTANISDEALFFKGTLYENLVFGMDTTMKLASRERVKAICQKLTKTHGITDYLEPEVEDVRLWKEVFSGAQCKLLSIARALIHNTEILCIHKPLVSLTDDDADLVIQCLKEHISGRGLMISCSPLSHRRPRTVIVSAATATSVAMANTCVSLDPMRGLMIMHHHGSSAALDSEKK